MDIPPPKKSFESLLAAAKQERVPEVQVRRRIHWALAEESAPSTMTDYLAGLMTPQRLSLGLAALGLSFAFSGLQVLAALSILEEALLLSPLVWL